jgi:hypothetical protein
LMSLVPIICRSKFHNLHTLRPAILTWYSLR